MAQIATKFVKWDVPELATLQDSHAYKLRERIYFRRGIALCGYHFDFSDILKRYFVKQHGQICEYYAIDKTALRSVLYGRIEVIVEVNN